MKTATNESDHPGPGRRRLKFRWLPGPYAVVRLAPDAPLPEWATKGEFTSVTRTAEELSVVCRRADLLFVAAGKPELIAGEYGLLCIIRVVVESVRSQCRQTVEFVGRPVEIV